MRFLLINTPVPKLYISDIVKDVNSSVEINLLKKLSILFELDDNSFKLNKTFQLKFTQLLYGVNDKAEFGTRATDKTESVSTTELQSYASEKWESILHFMVESEVEVRLTHGVLELLRSSNLMVKISEKSQASERNLRITNKGFQFLLQDLSTQIWTLLLQYVEIAEDMSMDMIEVLGFFFFISNLEISKPYSTQSLTNTQITLLKDLRDCGIIYQKKSHVFYTTALASHLSLCPSNKTNKINEAFLILETNYRVYAYTNSSLQIAILALFVQLTARFPNLVVGIITRDSVRTALAKGITAEQIVHFLKTHAHVQMIKENSSRIHQVIPQTVTDQINLWEMELNRLKFSDGFLYRKFASEKEYNAAVQYAKGLNVLVWESSDLKNRCFVVSPEGHEVVKQYVRGLIAKRQAGV